MSRTKAAKTLNVNELILSLEIALVHQIMHALNLVIIYQVPNQILCIYSVCPRKRPNKTSNSKVWIKNQICYRKLYKALNNLVKMSLGALVFV